MIFMSVYSAPLESIVFVRPSHNTKGTHKTTEKTNDDNNDEDEIKKKPTKIF